MVYIGRRTVDWRWQWGRAARPVEAYAALVHRQSAPTYQPSGRPFRIGYRLLVIYVENGAGKMVRQCSIIRR